MDHITQFADWLRNDDKGDKTITTYVSVLSKFIQWYEHTEGTRFSPNDVTPIVIQEYRSFLQNVQGQKPASINKALAALKTFFGWAVEARYIDSNPTLKVKMKRVQQTHATKWLTEPEQIRLMYSLDTQKNEFKEARDKAIILTMLQAGLRVEEVSNLRVPDVDLRNENVTVVNGKGGKYRTVPMTKDVKKALKRWLTYRQSSTKDAHHDSDFLFVSERSGHMTTRGIAYLVDGYLDRCGLLQRTSDGTKMDGQHSCHSLRHTFCKNLIDVGWPIQNVARVAGHDSIQTTMRYVEPSQGELRSAMAKL